MSMNIDTFETRLWSRIEKTPTCWNWRGSVTSGYGQVQYRNKTYKIHRFIYEKLVGNIPNGLHIDHLCKNQICVNPKHLEAVTPFENTLRSTNIVGINARKTHCKSGHPLLGDNLITPKDGSRQCRICRNAYKRVWRLNKKLMPKVPQT